MALRQRKGRTVTFVTNSEADGVEIAASGRVAQVGGVCRRSRPLGPAASGSDRWSHQSPRSYAADGANTNQVESFFSRLRRMLYGQHHGVSPKYLHQYSAHAAWLEDHRRNDNGANARRVAYNAMQHPVSRV